jgi:hypothetical protein
MAGFFTSHPGIRPVFRPLGRFDRKLVYEPLGLAWRLASRTSSESSSLAIASGGDLPTLAIFSPSGDRTRTTEP